MLRHIICLCFCHGLITGSAFADETVPSASVLASAKTCEKYQQSLALPSAFEQATDLSREEVLRALSNRLNWRAFSSACMEAVESGYVFSDPMAFLVRLTVGSIISDKQFDLALQHIEGPVCRGWLAILAARLEHHNETFAERAHETGPFLEALAFDLPFIAARCEEPVLRAKFHGLDQEVRSLRLKVDLRRKCLNLFETFKLKFNHFQAIAFARDGADPRPTSEEIIAAFERASLEGRFLAQANCGPAAEEARQRLEFGRETISQISEDGFKSD